MERKRSNNGKKQIKQWKETEQTMERGRDQPIKRTEGKRSTNQNREISYRKKSMKRKRSNNGKSKRDEPSERGQQIERARNQLMDEKRKRSANGGKQT